MNFYVTGRRVETYKARNGEMKTREIKVGFWKDRSKYTAARVQALRAERGVGRPPHKLLARAA
jgi:hypothetical protein